ncbi:hypothetical protein [Stenotrophomonas sp.]|uniref:hypothetical protein n=1 Tax=Stenotrophomonas sp. TaxID=69392 RepID=UPI00289987FB|nr:hypothetical protein [Stenotrophomonas sp.]
MNARIRRTAAIDPALSDAWEQLQVHYATHQNSAPFWSAYQAIQDQLTRSHPQHRIDVCNQLATLAERLGVVDQAQLLAERRPDLLTVDRHAGSTPS